MGEKPTEADEAAGQREAGSGMATGIAIGEEGVQRVQTADMDADGIAVEEQGIQRQGAGESSEGIAIEEEGVQRTGGGEPGAQESSTTIKSTKSNTSD